MAYNLIAQGNKESYGISHYLCHTEEEKPTLSGVSKISIGSTCYVTSTEIGYIWNGIDWVALPISNLSPQEDINISRNTFKLEKYDSDKQVPYIPNPTKSNTVLGIDNQHFVFIDIVQSLGTNSDKLMSQGAITNYLATKQNNSNDVHIINAVSSNEGCVVLNSDNFTDIFVQTGGVDFRKNFTGKQIKTFYANSGVRFKSTDNTVPKIYVGSEEQSLAGSGYVTSSKIYLIGYTSGKIPVFMPLLPVPSTNDNNKIVGVINGEYKLIDKTDIIVTNNPDNTVDITIQE